MPVAADLYCSDVGALMELIQGSQNPGNAIILLVLKCQDFDDQISGFWGLGKILLIIASLVTETVDLSFNEIKAYNCCNKGWSIFADFFFIFIA